MRFLVSQEKKEDNIIIIYTDSELRCKEIKAILASLKIVGSSHCDYFDRCNLTVHLIHTKLDDWFTYDEAVDIITKKIKAYKVSLESEDISIDDAGQLI